MDGCEPRIKVIVKIQKKSWGGFEPRIEVIVKMQKKKSGEGGPVGGGFGVGGDRVVGCAPRIKVIVKMQKKQQQKNK